MSIFWRIYIYIKRLIQKPAFIIALLIMPFLALGAKAYSTMDNNGIFVGVYAEGENGKAVCKDLTTKDYSVNFVVYDDLEALKKDVEFKTLECGYVFTEDFEKGFKDLKLRSTVGCITSNSSVLHKVTNEMVYASIMNSYSPKIAEKFLSDKNINISLTSYFNKYIISDDVFAMDTKLVDSTQRPITKSFSVANFIALYMLIGAILLSVIAIEDSKKGIRINGYYSIFAGVILFVVVALLSSTIAGEMTTEIFLKFLCYGLLLSGYGYLFSTFKSTDFIFGLLPIVAITALVLTPVFINPEEFIKQLAFLKYLYPPTYFVEMKPIAILISSGVMNGIAILFNYKKYKRLQ